MICEIYVSNYALIKELRLKIPNGFSTITGETGAGKSILLGALGLVLGNRADVKALNNPDEKCVVEVTFNIKNLNIQSFFAENELDFAEETILRREILPSGKSRAFVNDTPVLLDVIKELGEHLVDIHSQHDSILLMNSAFQLQLIDALAQNDKARADYAISYQKYNALLRQREELQRNLEQKTDTDYLQFLCDELENARIVAGEELEAEEQLKQLRHADDIQKALATAFSSLNNDFAAIQQVHEAYKSAENAAKFLADAHVIAQRLLSVEIELKDIADELEQRAATIFVDDEKLQQTEERLGLINHLMHKHRLASTEELISVADSLSAKLHAALHGEKALLEIEQKINSALQEVKKEGEKLSTTRKQTVKKLEAEAAAYLKRLQFAQGTLVVAVSPISVPNATGLDQVQFLFAANVGIKPMPVNKVASGGELSRIMLALKAILSQTRSLPAIIFDEIDAGISGETAQRVADILKEMGQKMQVLAITHLPQIAARGGSHFIVKKKIQNGTTVSEITLLSAEERVNEIARLLSGATISEAAKTTAQELLVG